MRDYEENNTVIKGVNSYIVKLFKPDTREEAMKIPGEFHHDTIGIINLNSLEQSDIERVSDFFTGYMYGVEGTITHAGENVYICSPKEIIVEDKTAEPEDKDDAVSKSEPIIYRSVDDGEVPVHSGKEKPSGLDDDENSEDSNQATLRYKPRI